MTEKTVTDDELGQLARRQNDLFRRVREGTLPVARVLGALQGIIEGNLGPLVINCDVNPFIPDGWSVESHKKGGTLIWDAMQVALYLSKKQKNGGVIKGVDLRKELEKKPVMNACVLDALYKHPELIPESWKGEYVFFWGTIYRFGVDSLCVRYLYWHGDRWNWDYYWLDDDWNSLSPALVRAS